MISSFQNRYRLCELFGIPLHIDFSLVLLLAFFVISSGFDGVACALLLLVSITLHELGHALTARAFGYETHDITLSLLGGCASLIALPRKANQEFLTALAGPAVSFLLSFAGGVMLWTLSSAGGLSAAFSLIWSEVVGSFGIAVGSSGGLWFSHETSRWLLSMLVYFSVMNGVLGFFNLLPGFPLDGGRIFRSAMRSVMPRVRATYVAMMTGRVVAVLIGLTGLWRMVNGRGWGLVTMMIAWMIWRDGYREYLITLQDSAWDYSARVSPPPYGGEGDECDVRKN